MQEPRALEGGVELCRLASRMRPCPQVQVGLQAGRHANHDDQGLVGGAAVFHGALEHHLFHSFLLRESHDHLDRSGQIDVLRERVFDEVDEGIDRGLGMDDGGGMGFHLFEHHEAPVVAGG